MIRILCAFAQQCFREAIRNKILYGIGFFALVILLFSLVLGELSLYEQERVIKNVGLGFLSILGVSLAIFTGVGMLQREIQEKTIYTILSKPIYRGTAIVGKFLGIALTLGVELIVMYVIFSAILLARGMSLDLILFQAFWLIYCQSLIIAATAILFSSFSDRLLSVILSVSIFILGSLHEQISYFAERQESQAIRALMRSGQFLLPNLSQFNLSASVSYSIHVQGSYVAFASLHALAVIFVMLCIAVIIFERRDFV
ncbi:MAG: ABC transporter permease subunit [Bradymonadales bacterium]|jgi:ABC-type transport system involved in multi-copper enzyme maturation permease subunit